MHEEQGQGNQEMDQEKEDDDDDDDDEEEDINQDIIEQGIAARPMPVTYQPSQSEIAEYELAHVRIRKLVHTLLAESSAAPTRTGGEAHMGRAKKEDLGEFG